MSKTYNNMERILQYANQMQLIGLIGSVDNKTEGLESFKDIQTLTVGLIKYVNSIEREVDGVYAQLSEVRSVKNAEIMELRKKCTCY